MDFVINNPFPQQMYQNQGFRENACKQFCFACKRAPGKPFSLDPNSGLPRNAPSVGVKYRKPFLSPE